MAPLVDEAEALAWGLGSGIVDVDEVVLWADLRIMSTDAPSPTLCDVATSGRTHPLDLASLLRLLPGDRNSETVHDLKVRLMLRTLNESDKYARVVAMAIDRAYLGDWFDDVGLGDGDEHVEDALRNADYRDSLEGPDTSASRPIGAERAAVIEGMKQLLRRHISQQPRARFEGEPNI
ncbi:MAG: hypothetical protein QUV05_06065 [Phycisphaerae bacterium]|nr:hypothetical protein [Phycisphaerae bacterium]